MMKAEGFGETLRLLSDYVGGNEDKLAKLLKRKEGLVATMALLNGQADTYMEKNAKMAKVAGATDDAFRKQTEGINKTGFEMRRTQRRLMDFSMRLGDRLLPIMERLLDRIEPWLQKIEDLDEESLDLILTIGGLAMAIGPLVTGIGKAVGVFSALKTAMATAQIAKTASDLGDVATQAGNATGKIKGLTALKWVVGPLAAFAAGYGLGTLIHEKLIEPAAAKKHTRDVDKAAAASEAKWALKSKSEEYKERTLERLRKVHDESKKRTGGILGEVGVHRTKEYKEREAMITKLESDLQQQRAKAWMREEGIPFETRMQEKKQTTEIITRVKFENLPPGTKVTTSPIPAGLPDVGPVMGGI